MSEAEQQVAAAVSARATAELAALEADTDARRSTLRGDSAQTGICAFFRKGSGSSDSLFVTPSNSEAGPLLAARRQTSSLLLRDALSTEKQSGR